jgi:hypothetical protein
MISSLYCSESLCSSERLRVLYTFENKIRSVVLEQHKIPSYIRSWYLLNLSTGGPKGPSASRSPLTSLLLSSSEYDVSAFKEHYWFAPILRKYDIRE